MKNLKLIVLAVSAILFLGIGSVNAQGKSTVIITGNTYSTNQGKYQIEIVKPNYEVEKKELNDKDANFFAFIKKEIDYWLNQDYKLVDATANSLSAAGERVLFILIKED